MIYDEFLLMAVSLKLREFSVMNRDTTKKRLVVTGLYNLLNILFIDYCPSKAALPASPYPPTPLLWVLPGLPAYPDLQSADSPL